MLKHPRIVPGPLGGRLHLESRWKCGRSVSVLQSLGMIRNKSKLDLLQIRLQDFFFKKGDHSPTPKRTTPTQHGSSSLFCGSLHFDSFNPSSSPFGVHICEMAWQGTSSTFTLDKNLRIRDTTIKMKLSHHEQIIFLSQRCDSKEKH